MLLAAVIALTAACTSSDEVRGVVLEVEGTLTSVESFVLRTDAGDIITVVPSQNSDERVPDSPSQRSPVDSLSDHRGTRPIGRPSGGSLHPRRSGCRRTLVVRRTTRRVLKNPKTEAKSETKRLFSTS